MDDFCQTARIEFKRVVTADPMQVLVNTNKVNMDLPPMGRADIDKCIDAPYMFC